MAAQIHQSAESHWRNLNHLKRMEFMVYKLYLKKAIET